MSVGMGLNKTKLGQVHKDSNSCKGTLKPYKNLNDAFDLRNMFDRWLTSIMHYPVAI